MGRSRLTHLGGPTVLVELDGWRILTDPTFDPPGRTYGFGWGTSSTKTAGPALAPDELGPVDVVLLSHDHHADNLDDRGRALLPARGHGAHDRCRAPGASARRNVRGLARGRDDAGRAPGRPELTVTATPCRHGPPLSRPSRATVIGFALRLATADRVALWMTGDTVLLPRRCAAWPTGSTSTSLLAAPRAACGSRSPDRCATRWTAPTPSSCSSPLRPRVAVPVHYEGWSHFREAAAHAREALPDATWLEPGVPTLR